MTSDRIRTLLDKHAADLLTSAERDELLECLNGPSQEELASIITAQLDVMASTAPEENQAVRVGIFNKVVAVDKSASQSASSSDTPVILIERSRSGTPRRVLWAAASILLILTSTIFFWPKHETGKQSPVTTKAETIIQPGTNGAILTLADGTQLVLDSMGNGVVANQHGVKVSLKNGELAYDGSNTVSGLELYNTMTTPKGRQFMVVLPDGTRVWLNSGSSLRYPLEFAADERLVSITGEAYFEVAKKTHQPFRVNVSEKALVEVLGTHFNVNAYDNEQLLRTTLLEGSVRIYASKPGAGKDAVVLRPGQQAQLDNQNDAQAIRVSDKVNIESVMAWKNGVFNFEGMHLRDVMRQLERWYDIEVAYEPGVKDMEFYGELRRTNSLNDIIAAFKDAEVNFKIEGRKLIVMKN